MTLNILIKNQFVWIYRTAESYRKSFIATSGGQALRAHKLFCSWDFGISNQQAADMKHRNIFLELKSIVTQLHDNECFLSIGHTICGYAISTVIWLFVMFVLIVISSSILFAEEILEVSIAFLCLFRSNWPIFWWFSSANRWRNEIFVLSGGVFFSCADICRSWIADLSESVWILRIVRIKLREFWPWNWTTDILIIQFNFSFCSLEIKIVKQHRSPRSQLHIALIRNYLLNIVTITSFVWYWLSRVDEKV